MTPETTGFRLCDKEDRFLLEYSVGSHLILEKEIFTTLYIKGCDIRERVTREVLVVRKRLVNDTRTLYQASSKLEPFN